MKIKPLAVAMIFIAMASANADDFDVQDLLRRCKAPPASTDSFFCVGYISAVVDLLAAGGESRRHDPLLAACPAEKHMSYGAWIQVFINWAERHPEHWSKPQSAGAATAIREAAPCKQN